VAAGRAGVVFMADGREPTLRSQAVSAALGHEEAAAAPTEAQLLQIVDFESQLYAAQSADKRGGLLTEANGPLPLGPQNLRSGRFGSLDGGAVKSFDVWRRPDMVPDADVVRDFRISVARGSDIFYGRKFRDGAGESRTCASCHASGTERWMNIGTATSDEAGA